MRDAERLESSNFMPDVQAGSLSAGDSGGRAGNRGGPTSPTRPTVCVPAGRGKGRRTASPICIEPVGEDVGGNPLLGTGQQFAEVVPVAEVIAHVSDTHFGNDMHDPAARAAAVGKHLVSISPHADVLVVTGDLADHGLAEEYAEARAWLDLWPGLLAV